MSTFYTPSELIEHVESALTNELQNTDLPEWRKRRISAALVNLSLARESLVVRPTLIDLDLG